MPGHSFCADPRSSELSVRGRPVRSTWPNTVFGPCSTVSSSGSIASSAGSCAFTATRRTRISSPSIHGGGSSNSSTTDSISTTDAVSANRGTATFSSSRAVCAMSSVVPIMVFASVSSCTRRIMATEAACSWNWPIAASAASAVPSGAGRAAGTDWPTRSVTTISAPGRPRRSWIGCQPHSTG